MDLKDLDIVITPTIIYNVTYRTTGPIPALSLDELERDTRAEADITSISTREATLTVDEAWVNFHGLPDHQEYLKQNPLPWRK